MATRLSHKFLPVGGLNSDDGYSIFPSEDYRNAENVSIAVAEDGKQAVIKNVKSNQVVANASLPEGTNTVIGSVEDKSKDRIYFFTYNSNGLGSHAIWCYRRKEGDIKTVFLDSWFASGQSGLNFNSNRLYFISGVAVVGDYLFWTDYLNQPRRINVERGLYTADNTYESPNGTTPQAYDDGNMLDEDITIIRRQPVQPITATKIISADDADVDDQVNNFIKDYPFQFAYRYVYWDNEKSTPSVYSKTLNYNNPEEEDDYDTIKVVIPKGEYIPYEVKQVEVLMRFGYTNSWYIIKTWSRVTESSLFDSHNGSGASLFFYFFNDRIGTAVSDEEGLKPFDNVPILSRALTTARNRIFLGNNTYGYSKPTGITFTAQLEEQEGGGDPITGTYWLIAYNSSFYDDFDVVVVVVNTGDDTIDGYYVLENYITFSSARPPSVPNGWVEDTFDAGDLPVFITLSSTNRFKTFAEIGGNDNLLAILIWLEYSGVGGSPRGFFFNKSYTGTQPTIQGLTPNEYIYDGYRQFKSNSVYQLGVVFYDFAGRKCLTVTDDNAIIKTPDRSFTIPTYNASISWALSAASVDIPFWATHYQIVRTDNLSYIRFLQHYTSTIRYVTKGDTGTYSYGTTYDKESTVAVAYDISRLENDKIGYVLQAGDILRGYSSDDTTKFTLPVIDQVGKWILVAPEDMGDLSDSGNANRTQIFEIYSPNRTSSDIFYEVGEVYSIIAPGTGSAAFSATSGVLQGDIVIKERDYGASGTIFVEAMSPDDDFWSDWQKDLGKPNSTGDDIGTNEKPTNVCYSETWIQGGSINGLCSFNALDQNDLALENGAIQKLVLNSTRPDRASVMLAVAWSGCASLYLGETQLIDNNDAAVLATSGDVIGTINNLQGGFGTRHPESVAVGNSESDGYVYWFDAYNGKVVRYATNGISAISNVKMSKYFLAQGKRAIKGEYLILGGYDGESDEYLLALPEMQYDETPEYLSDFISTVLQYQSVKNGGLTGIVPQVGEVYKITGSYPSYSGFHGVYHGNTVDDLILELPYGGAAGITTFVVDEPNKPFVVSATLYVNVLFERYTSSPHQLDNGRGKVLAFSEKTGRWTRTLTYQPECFALSGSLLLSFDSGNLYTHDATTYNTFYGTQYPSRISFVANTEPTSIKTYKTLMVSGNTAPYWAHIRTEDRERSTDLASINFKLRESIYHSEIFKDRLSPNTSGNVFQKKFAGDDMRSQFALIACEWRTFDSEIRINFIDVGCNVSPGHNTLLTPGKLNQR